MTRIILIGFLSCGLVWAEDAVPVKPEISTSQILLYDHANRAMPAAGPGCLPDRVYVRYSPLKQWNFVKCERGTFASPLEVMSEGTVVRGYAIGAKDINESYELVSGGQWVKSLRKERTETLVFSPQPVMRTISYFTVDSEGKLPAAGAPVPVATLTRKR